MKTCHLSPFVIQEIWPEFQKHFRSETSWGSYWSDLCEFSEIVKKDILAITGKDVRIYYQYLMQKEKNGNLQAASVKKKFMELHSFSSFLCERQEVYGLSGKFQDYFYEYIPHLAKQEKFAKSVPVFRIDKLLCAAENDRMSYAILVLLYRMGLSSTEICQLKKDAAAIYENGAFLEVEGRRHALYIPDDVLQVLELYMETRKENPYLFFNRRGNPLNTMYLSRMLKKYSDAAGIPSCSARELRNTCACNLFSYRACEEQVADHMGVTCTHIRRYKNRIYKEDMEKAAGSLVRIKVDKPL